MKDIKELVKKGLSILSFPFTEYQLEQFSLYLKLLLTWNKRASLTSLEEPEEIVEHHFIDSLFCLVGADFDAFYTVLDVGTGAGFPGVPIKICKPHIALTLLESKKKKVNFLYELLDLLRLRDVRILHGRAEEFGKDPIYKENYHIVLCRAIKVEDALHYCLPFARKGGRILLLSTERERKAISANVIDERPYILPFSKKRRCLFVIEK